MCANHPNLSRFSHESNTGVLAAKPCTDMSAEHELCPPMADEVDQGFELARKYCGRCHGEGSYQGAAQLFDRSIPMDWSKRSTSCPGDPSIVVAAN